MPCLCLSSFPLKKTLCPSSVVVLPKFFHLISQSPRMFHLYLSISCVSSWNIPAAVSVPVFHVRQKAWSLLTRAVTDPVCYGCSFSSHGESRAKYNLMEPIPHQVEHASIEFTMELFCSSGPFLLTMKISTQEYFFQLQDTTDALPCRIHLPVCL